MGPPRMTANPLKPARHRPGKGPQQGESEDDDDDDEEEEEAEEEEEGKGTQLQEPESTRTSAGQVTGALRDVKLEERRARAAIAEAARVEAEKAAKALEDEFETEESSKDDSDKDEEEEESSEGEDEESSSEDEAPRKLLRPTFIRKDQRKDATARGAKTEDEIWAEEEARKKQMANELVQEQLEKRIAARAAGKKDWDDDDDVGEAGWIDDTDGLDPEAEHAAWKLRELKRIKRAREVIEQAEEQREEVERRRNLTAEEREAEDRAFLEAQKEEQSGKGKAGFMQRYHHRGAFFQDDEVAAELAKRDIMGSRFVDDAGGGKGRETLPEYMQIRDMAKLGRKSRTKYKDLRAEDTGRWGVYDDDRKRRAARTDDVPQEVTDERFMPDRKPPEGRDGPSGANATAVKERRRERSPPKERAETEDKTYPIRNPHVEHGSRRLVSRERDSDRQHHRSERNQERRHRDYRNGQDRSRDRDRTRRRDHDRNKYPDSDSDRRSDRRRSRRSSDDSRSPPPRQRKRRSFSRERRKRSPSPLREGRRYGSEKKRRLS